MTSITLRKQPVALLDILGFKEKVLQTPLDVLSKDYEKLIKLSEAINKPFEHNSPSAFPNHPNSETWCERYIFSDTIILLSKGEDISSCLKLLVYTWRLAQCLLAQKIPFRGAIAYDELYVNLSQNIVLGKALIKAHELEQAQQWVGIAIDSSLEEAYPEFFSMCKNPDHLFSTLFMQYHVPFKDGSTKLLHTINWRFNLIVEKGTRSLFAEDTNGSVVEKIKNALKYAKAVIDRGKIYVYDQKHLAIELRSFYVGGGSEPPFKHGDEF